MLRSLCTAVLLVLGLMASTVSAAQDWPVRPIRLIVMSPPGGFPDFAARTIADQLNGVFKHPIVVENRPGAGGNLAAGAVAQAAPDGHTILLTGNNIAVNVALLPNPGFDYVKSFAPITLVAKSNMMLVAAKDAPVNSLAEAIAFARAKPDELSIAVSVLGTPSHLGVELLLQTTNTQMLMVPYKGVGPALPDLLSGRTHFALFAFPAVQQLVEAGKLKALGVSQAKRSSLAPNLPTIAEQGVPGFDVAGWVCLMAPAGTPPEIINRLNAAVREVLAKPDVKSAFDKQALEIATGSPEELAEFIAGETKTWTQVLSKAVLKDSRVSP